MPDRDHFSLARPRVEGSWSIRPPDAVRATAADHAVRATSVVLVDASEPYRSLVARALRRDGGFAVVGEATAGLGALELVRRHRPQVVLMEAEPTRLEELDAVPTLRAAGPTSEVVVLAHSLRPPLYDAAMGAGALGVIRKGSSLSLVVRQLRGILGTA